MLRWYLKCHHAIFLYLQLNQMTHCYLKGLLVVYYGSQSESTPLFAALCSYHLLLAEQRSVKIA